MSRKRSSLGFILTIVIAANISLQLIRPAPAWSQDPRPKPGYEWGLSLLSGNGEDTGDDIDYYGVYPMFGFFLSESWQLGLEGNISHYQVSSTDFTALGLNAFLAYEFFRSRHLGFFGLGGGGLVHLDIEQPPLLGDTPVIGLVQAGGGIKIYAWTPYLIRLEYRFQHLSDPFDNHDHGLNYHCVVLSISHLLF